MSRTSALTRTTKETDISLELCLDGTGKSDIKTGLHFFDHMLENFSKHASFDLSLSCKGDLKVDEHHTIEDVALVLGEAFAAALSDKRGLARYGQDIVRISEKILPMDEAVSYVALDLSGRPFLSFSAEFTREYVGDFPTEMLEHFFRSFCDAAKINLHIRIIGKNTHHIVEIAFKSFARALREAVIQKGNDLPSTKGML